MKETDVNVVDNNKPKTLGLYRLSEKSVFPSVLNYCCETGLVGACAKFSAPLKLILHYQHN